MRHKPTSIKQIGLQAHLNQTKQQHNDFGYDAFVSMLGSEVNKSNIAKAFGVDRKTVTKWLEVYKGENNNGT